MSATLTKAFKAELLHKLAAQDPVLTSEGGRNFLRYDEITFDFMRNPIEVAFWFQGHKLSAFYIEFNVPAEGTFHLRGVEGRMEYQLT